MAISYEEILELFREVAEAQKETQRISQETKRMFQETERKFQETDRKFQETDRKFQDTDRKFQDTDRKFQETDRKFQETDRKIQETDRLVRELSKTFGGWSNRLGEFVEEMVRPAVVRLFRSRGLEVHQVMRDVTAVNLDGEEGIEVDLLITNAQTAIGVECKSRLTLEDVQEHLARLAKFKRLFPQYAGYRLLGAVAAMVLPDDVARYAYRQGLFVLAQSGDTILIRNDDRFTPKEW
ncbi:DUF3782 domain-containing protein [Thiocystis minor]|uniref:DUF3782 domain-containing protein n=1 Tax=Thiocystis minor TaxID=61597 RepID=UPI001F5CC15D|nr:DUF3782 domain-containing protein [Thiocystis minor]MBK5964194.1 DUF3782 domain-containing protein [Thiocystis minor]